ncbi:plasmid stabilization system protein ParE [Dyadobacter sp. BE34]|uniref:Plasmid stabilization system protein ParE n=1 Tax=Dyadobacter fermentans TaxID=94254 RepID=A0ABU1R7G8_9BACT|nr:MULTISPECIES: type II toxin-antitoxin system RelE/ParE family toxin [Dyadobacter]MDR6809326.1 plasmid stabilization system protein ParE [Dyadobacter fermentans]MDR7047080.1 plasmid stabilization system protein ParE [Dyadobacter sp. BE242]MDR7194953.1 plasmid stabilization system protein ParE [Dyadobacter sp. BE34]MDR7214502.1 plasmid stabilization system protein ParE [Dyadobacter sp. BE31]MDR7266875.1 plasmid stabilization system protein ParE [Dyadobacter sp. BE32]
MAYEIEWTDPAKENFSEIVGYLFDTWGEASAEKFTAKLEASLAILEQFSFAGKQHDHIPAVHELVISKHHSLFYIVHDRKVMVINILNSARRRH